MHILEVILERFGFLMCIFWEAILMTGVCTFLKFIVERFGSLMSILLEVILLVCVCTFLKLSSRGSVL